MAWDFSTEPEFQSKLDWMRAFVREQIWPLETLIEERRGCGPHILTPSSAGRDSGR